MTEVDRLIAGVERARAAYLARAEALTPEQGSFAPQTGAWCIAEITEHLYHAEFGGLNLIWRAADGIARGEPVWTGDHVNRGLHIEEVVRRTWREREEAPASAVPRMGGPLAFWTSALRSCTPLLAQLGTRLADLPLDDTIYPHVISGPLDARQRLQFLAFHLERHRGQVEQILSHPRFPTATGDAPRGPRLEA